MYDLVSQRVYSVMRSLKSSIHHNYKSFVESDAMRFVFLIFILAFYCSVVRS